MTTESITNGIRNCKSLQYLVYISRLTSENYKVARQVVFQTQQHQFQQITMATTTRRQREKIRIDQKQSAEISK